MDIQAQEIRAIRLVRVALQRGYMISLYPGDDLSKPYIKDSVDSAVALEVHFAERVTVVISGGDGATFLLSYGGDSYAAPITSYSRTPLGESIYDTVMGHK